MSAEDATAHPPHELDEHLNSPVRLSIVEALAHVDDAEFPVDRDAIAVSDSVLSKQVGVLESAGYVEARKGYAGKRPRTWLSLRTRDARLYAHTWQHFTHSSEIL
jgi:DNA-binding MarR family transcriptional regulator